MAMLEMRHIDKKFWGVYANRDVNLTVQPGEVHALLGENGAGKTTLMNILYGLYPRDGGEVLWQGEPVEFASPKDAIKCSIGMVHQHFMLVPTLTVSQNITLGLKEKGFPFTDRRAIDAKITGLSERYGLPVDPSAMVSGLSVGEQQRVEIMKLLYRGAKLLILDEPTAVLTPQETHGFFDVLKRLRADGCSVILITHRIPEVMEIADMVTVLRDTHSVVTAPIGEFTETSLSEHMIGRPLHPPQRPQKPDGGGPGLALQNVGLAHKGRQRLSGVSLDVPGGEIVGIAGVDGNGQKALAEVILGIRKNTEGTVALGGQDVGKALSGFFAGIFGSSYAVSEVFVKATPLILAGLGVSVAFKSGFVNIGAEGQLYMGAIAVTAIGMYLPGLPRILMLPLCLVGGFVAGGLWALIPGVLKARFGVSEVINTIMFNYIAIGLCGVLLQTVLKDPGNHFPMSAEVPAAAQLGTLIKGARLHSGVIIALVCAALVWVLVFKTPEGYRMRAVGLNRRACECGGIPVGRSILLSSLVSGGLAGIAGVCEIAGLHHKLLEGISPSYGYLAIIVALLGGNHPAGVVVSAVGIAALQVGSLSMQRAAGVPSAIASIIMGAVVMLILARKTLFKALLAGKEVRA